MEPSTSVQVVFDALVRPGPVLHAFGLRPEPSASTADARAVLDAAAGRGSRMRRFGAIIEMAQREAGEMDARELASWLIGLDEPPSPAAAAERFWALFSPHLAGMRAAWDQRVGEIRRARAVQVIHPAEPVDPRCLLFTANALIGPAPGAEAGPPDWWYDHPVPMGTPAGESEVVHGLIGLEQAMAFERDRGTISRPVTVIVSVSPTHSSLVGAATADVRRAIAECGPLPNLDVFVLDEPTVRTLVDDILAPAIGVDGSAMGCIGLMGPYGRHFSLLKAIAALWQAAVDPTIQATFKIDLDQVFPQDQLVATFGRSALELMTHPAWGAVAVDADGANIELGTAAGALVNAVDIHRGLLIPDVDPDLALTPADLVFCKRVPQALSTEAEMMDAGDDGTRQRIHVTGGTSGIRIDALRRSWPFTPSFVGRAEDQAYQLATFDEPVPGLRTVHLPGLVMRHDAGTIARASAERSAVRTEVGDLERFLVFSAYADRLGMEATRLLPFTGAYVTPHPAVMALLRLGARVVELAASGHEQEARDLFDIGMERLDDVARFVAGSPSELAHQVEREQSAWIHFSEAVAYTERHNDIAEAVRGTLSRCRVDTGEHR